MSSFKIGGLGSVVSRPTLVVAAGVVALGAGLFGGGCSSGLDLSTETSFCQAVAQADCSQAVVSACFLPNQNTLGPDTQTCLNLRTTPEICNPLNLPYHAAFAQPCLDAHTALYSSATLDPGLLAQKNQACAAVFNRGGQTGLSCTLDTDCDVGGGFSCVVHEGGKGTCQRPNPVNPGDGCDSPAAQCSAGYYCEASGHCVSDPSHAGASCGPGVPCGSGLRCLPNANGGTSACAAQLPDHAACMQDGDCQGGFCVAETNNSNVCAGEPAPLAFGTPACTGFTPK